MGAGNFILGIRFSTSHPSGNEPVYSNIADTECKIFLGSQILGPRSSGRNQTSWSHRPRHLANNETRNWYFTTKVSNLETRIANLHRSFSALTSYTFENMMYHVMNDRISLFSWKTLSSYWVNESQRHRCKVIDYYLIRVIGVLKMIDQLNIIGI